MPTNILDWLATFSDGGTLSTTNVGRTEVSFSTSTVSGGAPASQSSLVSDDELGAETGGHLRLSIDADSNGEGFAQRIEFRNEDFPPFGVQEVSFDLLGVDQNGASDFVEVRAFDFSGTRLSDDVITLVPAGTALVVDNTVDGETPVAVDSTDGNVTVTIAAANIGRIDIIYTSGPEDFGNPEAQFIGIGPLSITTNTIFDDTNDADNGVIVGTDEADLIFGGTEADGAILTGFGSDASGADFDTTFPDDTISAGGGDDRIYGGAGADVINGEGGEDTIFGRAGENVLNGGADADFIFGGTTAETISGGSGGDSLFGGGGTDVINGNAGNDRILLSPSEASSIGSVDGGGDTDTLEIVFNPLNSVADLRTQEINGFETFLFDAGNDDGTIEVLDAQIDGVRNIFFDATGSNTEVFGITMDDRTTLDLDSIVISNSRAGDFIRVTGDDDAETITGTFDEDSISGAGGGDSLAGGNGDDTLNGGAGSDSIIGDGDDDVIEASSGDDTVDGGDDDDTYDASALERVLLSVSADGDGTATKTESGGGSSTDSITAIETFIAAEDDSNPDGIAVVDVVRAEDVTGLSDDAIGTFSAPGGGTTAFGPSEDYQLSHILSGTSPDGALPIVGPRGDYEITRGDEAGQIGTVSFENFETIAFTVSDGIVDGLDTGEAMLSGFDFDGTPNGTAYVDLEGDAITEGDDSIRGNDGADTITAGAGADTVDGGEGNDSIDGQSGDDSLMGGLGNDTLVAQPGDLPSFASYDGGDDDDVLLLAGTEFLLSTATITDIETLTFEDSLSDVTASLTPDQLEAFDAITTDAGRSGVDHRIEVEMGDDTAADFSGLSFTNFDQSGDRVFVLGDGDAESITGSSINDVIAGGGGADSLSGEGGDDVFGAFTGDAMVDGGADTDIYDTEFVDVVDVAVDDTGAGTANKSFETDPDGTDTLSNIEVFVAGEAVEEADAIEFTTTVSQADLPTAVQGLSDDAAGLFTPEGGGAVAFGPFEDYAISDILAGTSPDGALPAVGPNGSYEIIAGDEDGQIGNIAYENFEQIAFSVEAPEIAANDDTVSVDEDDSVDVTPLDNDVGEGLGLITASALNGTVDILSETELRYTPDADFFGDDTISYVVADDFGQTDGADIAVTVDPLNDPPTAEDDTAATFVSTEVVIDVLANDSDVEGDDLTVLSATAGNGAVTITADNQLAYTPDDGFTGDDVIDYLLSDGTATDDGQVMVSVSEEPVEDEGNDLFNDFGWAAILLLLVGLAAAGGG